MERAVRRSFFAACLLCLGLLPLKAAAQSGAIISEFVASNGETLVDEDGDNPDWIEIYNPGDSSLNLAGWALTDDAEDLDQWIFPDVTLPPKGYLVVFASAKDRRDPSANLHTNFSLDANGEYLGLIRPDGSVAFEFAPEFPEQFRDISYGTSQSVEETVLLARGSQARYRIPTDDRDDGAWTESGFDDSLWSLGRTPMGYQTAVPGFTVKNFKANTAVSQLTVAENVIQDPDLRTSVETEIASTINYLGTDASGHYSNNDPFPGAAIGADIDDFVIEATATIFIPEAGAYTFGVYSDDGFGLEIGGQSISYPEARSPNDTLGVMNFSSAGAYPLRLVYFERGGGAGLELFAAPGDHTFWNEQDFTLAGDVENGGLAVNTLPDGDGASPAPSSSFSTDLSDQMAGNNSTLYARLNFNVDSLDDLSSLILRIRYDDGFVAWLNGTEIARHNAPASPAWESIATDQQSDVNFSSFEMVNVTEFQDQLRLGENVLAVQGLNLTPDDADFVLDVELVNQAVEGAAEHYFAQTSPGEPNGGGFFAFVEDTRFSVDRGFFTEPFQVAVSTDTPDAVIRYTLNGEPPTATTGQIYEQPILIDQTTALRAAAFKSGFEPSNVDTQTYLFLEDVIRQSPDGSPPPGWPSSWGSNTVDYGMDPQVVNNPLYSDTIIEDLKAIPSFSIVLDLDHLFDPQQGIYANPSQDGRNWERPCSVELLFPNGEEEGFQINAGIRIRGGFSRSTNNPKHAFRLFFRGEYGDTQLVYPLFGDEGTDTFDGIDLRTFQNYSWSFQGDSRGIFVRDQFNRDLQKAMGHHSERGRFYHLYINGVYWGLFNTAERPEASYGETYYGGDKEDYDVIKVEAGPYTINATDGNLDAWRELWTLAGRGFSSDADYQRAQGNNPDGAPNPNLPVLIDVPNLIDYMLIILYGGNLDAPVSNFLGNTSPNNFFSLRNRQLEARMGFHSFVHDAEHTLLDVNQDRIGPWPAGNSFDKSNPQYIWQQLQQNAEFRMKAADHIHRHFFNNGVLTEATATNIFLNRIQQIDRAVVGESARWGDAKRGQPFTRNNEWVNEVNNVLNNYMPRRSGIVLNQLRNDGLYPDLAAPAFSQHGGVVDPGYNLSMQGPSGAIYYTRDGSDPRQPGGAVSPSALTYEQPLTLQENARIRSRTRSGSTWSALNEADFIIRRDFNELIVTEIMYNPTRLNDVDGDEFEFIELKNVSAEELDLGGVRFTDGIQFAFENGTRLGPGQILILVRNAESFALRYPNTPFFGVYTGALSNGGERITLRHAAGDVIFSFEYNDEAPWPVAADGQGFSLVALDPNRALDPSLPQNWRASQSKTGSPGSDESPINLPRVVVNEILTNSEDPVLDAIELYNPTGQPADVSHWRLTDSRANPHKYIIPAGTQIPAGGYLVFTEDQFNASPGDPNSFNLSSTGEEVFLFSADADGNLTGYSAGFSFGAALNGVSFGRHAVSTGEIQYPPQQFLTLGAANSGPRVGPVVINEIQYHPINGEAEFIELKNISEESVSLFDPDHPENVWRIGGASFDFPTGVSMPPGGLLLVVSNDPDIFRASQNVQPGIPIHGPFAGALQDGGERLELLQPAEPIEDPDTGEIEIPYATVDEVRYDDQSPWPIEAAGAGSSLEKINPRSYGNDPIHWRASFGPPSPGLNNDGNRLPIVDAGLDQEIESGLFPMAIVLEGTAQDDGLPNPPGRLTYQWEQTGGDNLAILVSPDRSTTEVLLSGVGTYGFALTVSDSELTVSDFAQVDVVRPTGDVTLVSSESTWKYLDDGSNQGTAWRALDFDDSVWDSGRAQLGYGDGDEATVLSFGPNSGDKYRTYYFRHEFNVSNPASVQDLTVHLMRDDGAIVYLNGNEVTRQNMPGGAVAFDDFASNTVGGGEESSFFDAPADPSFLVQGRNVLAVEIHQANGSSSDISFDLSLTGLAEPVNQAPQIDISEEFVAMPEETITVPVAFADDGLPSPAQLTFEWTVIDGPAPVEFGETVQTVTPETFRELTNTLRFSMNGLYRIQTTVDDGEASASAQFEVAVEGDVAPLTYEEWIQQFFSGSELEDPDISGPEADFDQDGHTNREEFEAGTLPDDADSVFRVIGVEQQASNGQIQITFAAVPGKVYLVEYKTTLTSTIWRPGPSATATDAVESLSMDMTTKAAYIRIQVQ